MLLMGQWADDNFTGDLKWRHSQLLADHFWVKFIRDYLPALQYRGKWYKETSNIGVDQVVLIMDPQLPRASWPMGYVTQTTLGLDGLVWSATVKVNSHNYVRPVARLIPLPELKEQENDAIPGWMLERLMTCNQRVLPPNGLHPFSL